MLSASAYARSAELLKQCSGITSGSSRPRRKLGFTHHIITHQDMKTKNLGLVLPSIIRLPNAPNITIFFTEFYGHSHHAYQSLKKKAIKIGQVHCQLAFEYT